MNKLPLAQRIYLWGEHQKYNQEMAKYTSRPTKKKRRRKKKK